MKSINTEDFKVTSKINLSKTPTKLDIDTDKEQEELALDKVQIKLSKVLKEMKLQVIESELI